MKNQVLEAIHHRRSVRGFMDAPVSDEAVNDVLDAGRWAPSGLNNQPWRFVVVRDAEMRARLAELTHYGKVIRSAPVCVAVFLRRESCYDPVKDAQSAGACLQNMLLAAHSLGLGAVWLGEILRSAEQVRKLLQLPEGHDLQAVIALGHPDRTNQTSARHGLDAFVLGRY